MNIGILLWNTCNAKCAHCAVNSGPDERPVLTDEEIFSIIDSAFYDCGQPSIGLSGGEAFFYLERLLGIINYAVGKGALVSVNTNAFWGKSESKAEAIVKRIKAAGLSKLVVSTDAFHTPYVNEQCVVNVISKCISYHLPVDIQFVASKSSDRLHDFLKRHADTLTGISIREIPVHPVGRAEQFVPTDDLIGKPGLPIGLCPSAIPSVSAAGQLIPCCNTAGHLPALALGDARTLNLPIAYERFKENILFYSLWTHGPAALYTAAREAGLIDPESGYVDQCHLCHEIFKNIETAAAAKERAKQIAEADQYDMYMEEFRSGL